MKTVTILRSRIDDADYEDVLTAIDIAASDMEPDEEVEIRVIVKNDIAVSDEQDDEATETEDETHG